MSYFRLLDERSVERALQALLIDLARGKSLKDLPNLVAAKALRKESVELESFNLFSAGGSIKPYTWFLPKPKLSVAELLRVYERVADQPTHRLDPVGELAGHTYPRDSEGRRLFARFRADDQWLSPALLLAASAQYLHAEVESRTHNSVRMRFATGIIDISPEGCWSNTRRARVPQSKPCDAAAPMTLFPAITTRNPVLRALHEMADGSTAGLALTVAAHALNEGTLSESHLTKLARLEGAAADKALREYGNPELALKALGYCDEILENDSTELVSMLFEVATPHLISYRDLQTLIGSPTQTRVGRKIKKATRAKWRQHLHDLYEDTFNAVV